MDIDRKVYLSGNYGKCGNKPGIEEIHLPPELNIEVKHIQVEYMACFIDTNGIVWIVKDIENADGKWVCNLIRVTTVSNIRDMRGDSFGTLDNEGAAYFDEGWTSVKIDNTRRIEGLPPIIAIAYNKGSCLFLDYDGNVWGKGSNIQSQLTAGPSANVEIPVCINTDQFKAAIPQPGGRTKPAIK